MRRKDYCWAVARPARYVAVRGLPRTAANATNQAKKAVNYAESNEDDEDDAFDPCGLNSKPSRARRAPVQRDSGDEDAFDVGDDGAVDDDGKKPPSTAAFC
jgi:hypothetical protein